MSADLLLIPPPSPFAGEGVMLNALTIDVEDYFHVSGFEGCVSRSQWDDFPLRVADNTYRLLDILAAAACGQRSSSWAGWRSGGRIW